MLSHRTQSWRCIRALDTSSSFSPPFRRNAACTLVVGQQRFLRTASNIRRVDTRPTNLANVEKLSRARNEPWNNSSQAVSQWRSERATLKRQPDHAESNEVVGDMWLGKRDPRVPANEWGARKRELQYLKDPLEIATFVKKELGKDKAKEMLQLVRMASHSLQVVVSWNHLIDYHMAKERVSDALKIYNEMKKRAQFPDSYTYTILLRGLSINAHQSGALSQAVAVYHSMSAPNARVEPSIIHTNAVLRVCARALDMDALWGIAAKIPEKGAGAANATTFTTILNAIRQSLIVDVPIGESEQEVAARRERGVVEGRRIWEDIVSKWRNADLVIEEELVCAMGRLLLIGSRPRDWDDVLSLVEQTMDIPRLVPRLGTPARQEAGLPRLRATNTPEQYKFDDDHLSPSKGPVRGDEFLALVPRGVGSAVSHQLTYATPSNNTLSMVEEACQKIVANKAGEEYWNMLTDPVTYGIVPDVNNLNQRLRVLRQNRASGVAAKTLKEDFVDKGNIPRPGTWRIAMSTCVRDKNNHNSLKHASSILQLMNATVPDADPKAVSMYVELALGFPLAKADDLIDALTLLQPVVKNIRLQLTVGRDVKDSHGVGAVYLNGFERQDAITALRKVYGLYDKLLLSNLIPEERKAPFKAERARLSAFTQRTIYKDGARKLSSAKEIHEAGPIALAVEDGETRTDDTTVNRTQYKGAEKGERRQYGTVEKRERRQDGEGQRMELRNSGNGTRTARYQNGQRGARGQHGDGERVQRRQYGDRESAWRAHKALPTEKIRPPFSSRADDQSLF